METKINLSIAKVDKISKVFTKTLRPSVLLGNISP